MSDDLLWPIHMHPSGESWPDMDERIQPEDIASYAYPPFRKARYTANGWRKAVLIAIDIGQPLRADELYPLDVRDFGAQP